MFESNRRKKPLYRRKYNPRVRYKLINRYTLYNGSEGNYMIYISYLIRNNFMKALAKIESCNIKLCKNLASRAKNKHKLYIVYNYTYTLYRVID